MSNPLVLGFIFILTFFLPKAFAETIDLNDGRVIEGKIIERNAKSIKVDIDGGLGRITYYFDEIRDIDGLPFIPKEVSNQKEISTPAQIQSPDNSQEGQYHRLFKEFTDAFAKNDYITSEQKLLAAIAISPKAEAYYNLALVQYNEDKKDEAVINYDKALDMGISPDPDTQKTIEGYKNRKEALAAAASASSNTDFKPISAPVFGYFHGQFFNFDKVVFEHGHRGDSLSFIQGKEYSPDLEVNFTLWHASLVSLKNIHLYITPDAPIDEMNGTPVTSISVDMNRKAMGNDFPESKNYIPGEYSLDLSLGEIHDGRIQGVIDFKDNQGNHVDGIFKAFVRYEEGVRFQGPIWIILGLLYFCFWVWMLIDCSSDSASGMLWLFVILFVPLGPVLYFFIRRQKAPKI